MTTSTVCAGSRRTTRRTTTWSASCVKRRSTGWHWAWTCHPKALLGMTDANHWTAKQVMHDMWRSHGIPKAEQFADDLSEAYLRPALEEEGYPGWQNIVIGVDDSQVVISPDRTDDADKALDRIAISASLPTAS